jgi:hypothetical protein
VSFPRYGNLNPAAGGRRHTSTAATISHDKRNKEQVEQDLGIPAEAMAIPPKPKMAATIAITRKTSA